MALVRKLSPFTWAQLNHVPALFHVDGKNPHVNFSFVELKVIRGTMPHPANTDCQEVRNSITVQFNGAPGGAIVAHLFDDGRIKKSDEMHAENNQRRAEDERLLAEESRYPGLAQTPLRKEAFTKMMGRIQGARTSAVLSTVQKQLIKYAAEGDYRAKKEPEP